jgi:acetyl-CoA acyltransferase 1
MAGYMHTGLKNILTKSPHDIVFLSALRTPLTRAKKGGLKDAYPEELLSVVLRAILERNPNLDPARIQDVAAGTVLQELSGAKAGRMAMNHAGLPCTTAFHTINRQCSSSLAAITNIAHAIAVGSIDVGIGAGMESMTRNYGSRAIPTVLWPKLKESPDKDARDCIMPMGMTSENVAERYGVNRADQDAFAARSHQKAHKAQQNGLFDEEIVPVTTMWKDVDSVGPEEEITVTKDDGIRANASADTMAKLKPAFKENGSSTAGNSSQVTDGAAGTLLMRRSTATELGLSSSIMGKWAGSQVVGCRPDEMGIGPAVAIPKLLEYTGMSRDEVQIWEINEAFASQALYCMRRLGIDESTVNPKGGAIALGHPLGATGARQVATLLPEMKRQGKEVGVVSMCIGTGMGMASLIVRE